MSLWKNLFGFISGTSSGAAEKVRRKEIRSLTVTCSLCGTCYCIGVDAIIITMADALGGNTIVISDGSSQLEKEPDLVGFLAGAAPDRVPLLQSQARDKLAELHAALLRGKWRGWSCQKCHNSAHPNIYPSPASWQ